MLVDADAIQKFLNAPPGQLVAGGILAGIVWKFFEKIENILSDQTKFEIAVWLVGIDVERKVHAWPLMFSKLFYKTFGNKLLSWKAVSSSAAATVCTLIAMDVWNPSQGTRPFIANEIVFFFPIQVITNLVPDFLSVASTRYFLGRLQARTGAVRTVGMLALNVLVAFLIGWVCFAIMMLVLESSLVMNLFCKAVLGITRAEIERRLQQNGLSEGAAIFRGMYSEHAMRVGASPTLLASLFSSTWVWIYAGSGFLIKAAHRFDIGFAFFNRKFDIEKKPLSAIGLVAGAIVALAYWGFAIGARLV